MSTHRFSEKDIDQMIRSIGKPAPEQLRAKVMQKIEQIEREAPAKPTEQERDRTQGKAKGRERD